MVYYKFKFKFKYRLQCAPRSASKAFFGLSSFLVVNLARIISVTQKIEKSGKS